MKVKSRKHIVAGSFPQSQIVCCMAVCYFQVRACLCEHIRVCKVGWPPRLQKNRLLFVDPQLPQVTRKSVRPITSHIPQVPIMYCGISLTDPSNIAHIIHIKLSIRKQPRKLLLDVSFRYANVSVQLWRNANVGFCLIVRLNYSHPHLFYSLISFTLPICTFSFF